MKGRRRNIIEIIVQFIDKHGIRQQFAPTRHGFDLGVFNLTLPHHDIGFAGNADLVRPNSEINPAIGHASLNQTSQRHHDAVKTTSLIVPRKGEDKRWSVSHYYFSDFESRLTPAK